MKHICSRCRDVFYSNAEYVNHRCGVKLVPPPSPPPPTPTATHPPTPSHVDIAQRIATKGMPIHERLAALVPDDTTGKIHESMTVFQSLAKFLAGKTAQDDKVPLLPVDVRCLVRGLHALCDRIEEGARP